MALVAIGSFLIGAIIVKIVIVPGKRDIGVYSGEQIKAMSTDGIVLVAYKKAPAVLNHKWVILIHSYRSNHTFMNPYAERYLEEGYIVIQPDNRAHGESEGKYIGMGYLDQKDIQCWIRYIVEQDPEAEIVLHGVSMGASALMMLSDNANLPDNIVAVIEDCGYTSAKDYLSWKLKHKLHISAFPFIPIANLAFRITAGYYLYSASAINSVKKSKLPILFIHGKDDETVPVEDAYRLYRAANCRKGLMIVDNAGHGEALMVAKEKYWTEVYRFIGEQR